MKGAYLGPKFSENYIENCLIELESKYFKKRQMKFHQLLRKSFLIVKQLVGFKVGWNLDPEL